MIRKVIQSMFKDLDEFEGKMNDFDRLMRRQDRIIKWLFISMGIVVLILTVYLIIVWD